MRPSAQRNQNQLTFIPWLINEINSGHHPGLDWIDASQQVACIPWPRAKENLPLDELGVIYCWHKYRFGNNCNQNRTPSSLKGTFRAIINSRDEITKLRDEEAVIHIQINCGGSDGHTTPVTSPPYHSPPIWDQTAPRYPSDQSTPRYHTPSDEHTKGRQNSWSNGHSSSSVCSPSTLDPWSVSGLSRNEAGRTPSWEGSPYDVMTAPTWAQEIIKQEQRTTDGSCNVYISVYSRGQLLCDKRADLQNGLLLYSDTCDVDFGTLTKVDCEVKYGKGAKQADKLFISEIQTQSSTDDELYKALRNFNNGILLTSDAFFNILVQRLCRVRTYFGHSNQGGARQMRRPNSEEGLYINPVYSYISYLEMAGYLMNMIRSGSPINQSDQPTAVTYIAVGQEWTPSKPIQDLPLFIEIKHERAINFQQANLKLKSEETVATGIVVSITNSLDSRPCGALQFDHDMMSSIVNEMPDEHMELDFTGFLNNLELDNLAELSVKDV